MFIQITLYGLESLLLGVCYSPPPKIGYSTSFESVLLRLMPGYGHVLVMGDMNIRLLMTTHNLDYNQLTTGTYNFFLISQIKAKMWFK